MRRVPCTVEGLTTLYCSNIKLSDRLRWREAVSEDQHIMLPSLLALCVVDEKGERVRTQDEWDEWAGESPALANELFNQCLEVIGTAESAEKK